MAELPLFQKSRDVKETPMGTAELAYELIDKCFFPVLGTAECSLGSMEKICDSGEPTLVGTRRPLTWDWNNGICVVYDDGGKPWIRSTMFVDMNLMRGFASRYGLKKGAFVPHSNDGGTFKRLVLEQTKIQI